MTRMFRLCLLVSLFGFILATGHIYIEKDILAVPLHCSNDGDCTGTDRFAICRPVNTTDPSDGQSWTIENRCVCDEQNGYHKNGNITCMYYSSLGEICQAGVSECQAKNAVCRNDGANSGNSRCQCKFGYISANSHCAAIIFEDLDEACHDCELNDGTCYDRNGDRLMDGCLCPVTRSGINCQHVHVNVTCDLTSFTMRICYEPHLRYNFKSGSVMLVEGKGRDMACVGRRVSSPDPDCGIGHYKLSLPLSEDNRERCSTSLVMADISTKKYESKIVIQQDYIGLTAEDIAFKSYCSFATHLGASFNPIGISVVEASDRGEHHKPDLTLLVERPSGKLIPPGVSVRLGEKLRFKILLGLDGSYYSLRVIRCTASTSPTIPDPNAISIPLIYNSCPIHGQYIFTNVNTWRPLNGRLHQLRTGLITMFKMPHGRSVHLHCAVKLCLKGSDPQCAPVQCDWLGYILEGYGRKKRSYYSKGKEKRSMDVMISRELRWKDNKEINLYQIPPSRRGHGNGNILKVIPKRKKKLVEHSSLVMVLTLVASLLLVFFIFGLILSAKIRKSSRTVVRSDCNVSTDSNYNSWLAYYQNNMFPYVHPYWYETELQMMHSYNR